MIFLTKVEEKNPEKTKSKYISLIILQILCDDTEVSFLYELGNQGSRMFHDLTPKM